MIAYSTFCQIRALHETEHLSVSQIAAKLQLNCKTVARWLAEDYKAPTRPNRSSKLDPYKLRIKGWLEEHNLSAQQVLQRLREEGLQVGYSIVGDYVRLIRPRPVAAYLSLKFSPGECAQVDWGSWGFLPVGQTRRRLSFFVAVLCHSRMMYVEFTLGQSQEQFLNCHHNAFASWGGVPESVMVDNCKTAVLSHTLGQPAQLNPRYMDFASHYGFKIRACGVRKPHEKGRVENAVGYVKKNFLQGLDLPPWPALNLAARHWLDTVANVRLHGETRRTPREVLIEEKLKPLPALPGDTALVQTLQANSRFRVNFDGNRYSVPARLAGAVLTAKIYHDRIVLVHDHQIVAQHPRSYERHKDQEHPDHAAPLLAQRQKAREQQLLHRFLGLGPAAAPYYEQLVQRRSNARHHVQLIMALCEIHGTEAVVRALDDAHHFQAYSCEYVTNILEQRQRLRPEPGALHLTRAADLLNLDLPEPDLSIYEKPSPTTSQLPPHP